MPLSEEWWADPSTSVLDIMVEYCDQLKKMHVLDQQYHEYDKSIEGIIGSFDPESYIKIWYNSELETFSFTKDKRHNEEMMTKARGFRMCSLTISDGIITRRKNQEWPLEPCHDAMIDQELQDLLVDRTMRWRQLALPGSCEEVNAMSDLITKWVELTGATLPDAYGDGNETALNEWIASHSA